MSIYLLIILMDDFYQVLQAKNILFIPCKILLLIILPLKILL